MLIFGKGKTMWAIFRASSAMVMLTSCQQIQSAMNPYNIENPGTFGIPVRDVKALECDFIINHSATIGQNYIAGKYGDKMKITFADLDFTKMTGQMIGNAGAGEITLDLSENPVGAQIHIYEKTPMGNLNVTTIFFFRDPADDKGAVPKVLDRQAFAVHSRHDLIYDEASIAQASGPCAIKY